MKYFVDFEATQFSNEIIEIGCVREDGAEFKSYVNAKRKLTDFIKNLTGISQETIDAAPSSDEVFRNFYQWLKGDTNIEFYCYGNSDIDFVKKNLSKTTDFEAQAALSMIGMALNDYAVEVKRHFGIIKAIGLIKVLAHYRGVESIEQNHDALEDAKFLKEVYDCIQAEGEIEECPFPDYQKKVVKKPIQPKVEVPKEVPYIARIRKNQVVETYTTMDEAVTWIINQASENQRGEMKPENVAKRVRRASGQNQPYISWKWKIHGDCSQLSEGYVYTAPVAAEPATEDTTVVVEGDNE